MGAVGDAQHLLRVITAYVRESLPGRELCFVNLAWHAAGAEDAEQLEQLVTERRITRTTGPARAADVVRGVALRRLVDTTFDCPDKVWDAAEGSYAVAFGVAGFLDGASRRTVVTAYAYAMVAGIARAAVRLGRATPREAEHVISSLQDDVQAAVTTSEKIGFGDWYGFAPLWEFAQSRHEHWNGTLFAT